MSAEFRTTFQVPNIPVEIDYDSTMLLMGSCFSDSIGGKLQASKFNVRYNPFGVVFNPVSLLTVFEKLAGKGTNEHWENHFVERDGLWFHYFLHSSVYGFSKKELARDIEDGFEEVKKFTSSTSTLFLTLGTAWVYDWNGSEKTVANCHKVPQKEFTKRLLSQKEMMQSLNQICELFPEKNIVLTVSPVRHIKESLPLNAVSKSLLRVACHYVCEQQPNCFYFPSYELILDDLRDYRFFAPDLIHPNEVAINYVWEHFQQSFFSANTKALLKQWEKMKSGLGHRPLQPNSESHRKFLEKLLKQLFLLREQLNVEAEIEFVQKQI